jgi:hypothetical protein
MPTADSTTATMPAATPEEEPISGSLWCCDGCGDEHTDGSSPVHEDTHGHYCASCVNNCAHCNCVASQLATDTEGWCRTNLDDLICDRCYEDDYFTCASCCDVYANDQANECRDDYYCVRCLPDEDDEDEASGAIGDRHSTRAHVVPLPSPWTRLNRYHIGVELEVESVLGKDRAEQAQKILTWTNAQGRDITAEHHTDQLMYAESDGSLAYGFELVTAPLGLDDQRNLWRTALSPANLKGLSSHNTTTCGLHVHISRAKLSQLQIAKIVFFVNNPANYGFIKTIARRYGSHYCQAKNIPLAKGHLNEDGDRYQLVNLCNRNTIEFRLFKGTLKLVSLLA